MSGSGHFIDGVSQRLVAAKPRYQVVEANIGNVAMQQCNIAAINNAS
jgi:hypothetical protein